jgi:methanogenic corrinoid protein MtbC1
MKDLSVAVADLERDQVLATVKRRIEEGKDPKEILDDCSKGMKLVGERYEKGEYFLSELLLAAEIFKDAAATLEPYVAKGSRPVILGKVVLATLRGDIHDLGKNLLAVLLKAQGFEVHDMGVDVEPIRVVAEVKGVKPDFVGFSALMTSAFDSMKETAELLRTENLRDRMKIMIGGGATNALAKEFVAADFQTTDAAEGVRFCLNEVKKNGKGDNEFGRKIMDRD